MKPNIVPFGKYRDMPVESMSQDKNYLNWLLAQNWFAEKHSDLHTIIINNFQEPTDTPEHNALQALFLNSEFCDRFLKIVLNKIVHRISLIDIWSPDCGWEYRQISDVKIDKDFKSCIYALNFEVNGIDVIIDYGFTLLGLIYSKDINEQKEKSIKYCRRDFRIEIKPSIGDDYPSVLRQMLSMQTSILFLEKFTGSGVTEKQFIKIFNNQKRTVIFRRDIKD